MEVNKLTAAKVKASEAGKYHDGQGLMLTKSDKNTGSWYLRLTLHGKRREMGLGSLSEVSLAEARAEAAKWRAVVGQGKDPIKEREKQRRAAERNLHMLKDVAASAFEAIKADLKGAGENGRWFSPLELHVLPKLGKTPVAEIDQVDIRDCLKALWQEKPETCRKALNRLSITFRHAAALGLDVDLQAVDKAKELLGSTKHKAENIPSVHWRDVPAFYASLSGGTLTHIALRLLILTGVRSAALRHVHVSQIDGDVWTVPAELMKGREGKTAAFAVPLCPQALDLIAQARRLSKGDGYVFAGGKEGSVISDMTLIATHEAGRDERAAARVPLQPTELAR